MSPLTLGTERFDIGTTRAPQTFRTLARRLTEASQPAETCSSLIEPPLVLKPHPGKEMHHRPLITP